MNCNSRKYNCDSVKKKRKTHGYIYSATMYTYCSASKTMYVDNKNLRIHLNYI